MPLLEHVHVGTYKLYYRGIIFHVNGQNLEGHV